MNKELVYWMALTHMPKYLTRKKNELIVKLFHDGKTIKDFFLMDSPVWQEKYGIEPKHIALFEEAKEELSNYAFLTEDLLEQGYNIIPITAAEYSPILKKNLKINAPTLLYTKGNLNLLKEDSLAIVGSRKANSVSLEFTNNIAKNAVDNQKVVVSGFAKGVDRQALDAALKNKGKSIIVLPQGITTFKFGFKSYYREIIEGKVLVLSTFYPLASWSVAFAMARNPIIYGLASDIYVAESSNKGGTWSGVQDGLRKGRTIYIRNSAANEKNANHLLIANGGVPVDISGAKVDIYHENNAINNLVSESVSDEAEMILSIIEYTKKGPVSAKNIVDALHLDISARKVSSILRNKEEVQTISSKPLKFIHKSIATSKSPNLFD